MRRTSSRTLISALAVAVALLVSACGASGGSDADGDDQATTTAAEKTTTTTTEATSTTEADDDGGSDEAQARAESVDLTLDDFPEGWDYAEATEDEGPSGMEQCDETSSGDEALGSHTSGDFSIGDITADDGVQVRIKTKVFPDEGAAEAALAPFEDEVVIACVDDLFKAQFTGAGTIDGEMGTQDYGDTDADQAVAVAGQYTVTTDDGTEVPVVVAVAVLRTGDVATQIQVTGVGDTIQDIDLDAVAARVEELQAAA